MLPYLASQFVERITISQVPETVLELGPAILEVMLTFSLIRFSQWQERQEATEEEKAKKNQMYQFLLAFRETFSRPVRRIRFMGLFDTGKCGLSQISNFFGTHGTSSEQCASFRDCLDAEEQVPVHSSKLR